MANDTWKWRATPYAPKSINPKTGKLWTFEEFKAAAEAYSTTYTTPTTYPTTGEEAIAAGYPEWTPEEVGAGVYPPWMPPPTKPPPGYVQGGTTTLTTPTTPTMPTLPAPVMPTITMPPAPPAPAITTPPKPIPPTMPKPPTITVPPTPTPPVLPEVPTLEKPTMPEVPTITPPTMPEMPTVPPYEPSPKQAEVAGDYADELAKWREAKGYGIPEDVQSKMFQRVTDTLNARETENIRVMKNNMESRQITNSGFVFANEMTIKANTTVAIANSIRDIQISSALMKMASFEKSMGATAQFIGYLADESAKAYAPKMAEWGMKAQYDLTKYGVEAQYGLSQAELEARYGLAKYTTEAQYGLSQAELEARYGLAGYTTEAQFKMAGFTAEVAAIMAQAQIDAQYGLTAVDIAAKYGLTEYQAQVTINMSQAQIASRHGLAGYEAQVKATMAQFQANTLATMTNWQSRFDLLKMEINQAYNLQNMQTLADLQLQMQNDQQAFELEMFDIEMEANEQVATTTGIWGFLGTLFGWLFGGF